MGSDKLYCVFLSQREGHIVLLGGHQDKHT